MPVVIAGLVPATAIGMALRKIIGVAGTSPATTIYVAAAMAIATIAAAYAADAPPGADSCSGCHPARAGVDTPVARLAGQDPAAIVAAMAAFRSGKRPASVMDRIAKGFSDDEVKAIAAWYGAQR